MKFEEAQNLIALPKWVVDENGDMPQGFVGAFNSFMTYLHVQTRITFNRMVI